MIFDCHFRHAIVINRLSIQINRHLSTPIDCTTSSGHSIIRLFHQSIANDCTTSSGHSIIRLFPQSIANDCTTSSDHSIIRLFHQSIAQGLHPGLGCVASSTLERMNFIPPRCIFQQPLFSSFSNLHTILWISNNLHVDGSISS